MSKRIGAGLLGGIIAFSLMAGGESELSAPAVLERPEIVIPAGSADLGGLPISPRTRLQKFGSGTLTVPTDDLRQGNRISIDVREGSLEFVSAPTPTSVLPADVQETLGKAACWLDTSQDAAVVRDANGNVTDLLDVRETGSVATGCVRVRGHVDTVLKEIYPLLRTDGTYGKRGLYFHDTMSGCWLNLVSPDGTDAKFRAYHIFAVQGITSDLGFGNIFGVRNAGHDMRHYATVHDDRRVRAPIWSDANPEGPNSSRARTYVNGEMVDGSGGDSGSAIKELPLGFSVLEVRMVSTYTEIGCFFNDRDFAQCDDGRTLPEPFQNRGGYRIGGEYLSEVLVFTEPLSEVERITVENYLQEKWFGVARPSAVSVETAPGTDVTLPLAGADLETLPLVVTGRGHVNVGVGSTYLASCLPTAVRAGSRYEVSQDAELPLYPLCARRDDVGAGDLVKSGNGELKLDALPESVNRVSVEAGTLTLTAPAGQAAPRVCGLLTNASFEQDVESDPYGQIWVGESGFAGWTATFGNYTVDDGVWVYNSGVPGWRDNAAWGFPNKVPDGTAALVIKRNAGATAELVIPEDGVYRVSLKAASRRYDESATGNLGFNHSINLVVGADTDHLQPFACLRTSSYGGFYSYSYRLPYLAKGTYRFGFQSTEQGQDRCTLVDDIKIVREEAKDDWLLPNGNFDELKADYAVFPKPNEFSADNASALAGWTLVQPSDPITDYSSAVAPVSAVMYVSTWQDDVVRGWMHNLNENDGSPLNLHLCVGGSASSTFTPPKGTFRLRSEAKMARYVWPFSHIVDYRAKLTLADSTEIDLGTVTHDYAHEARTDTFPIPVTFDGETPVTLTLWIENGMDDGSECALSIDNVRLASVVNLVSNGDFDSSDWSYVAGTADEQGARLACHRVFYPDALFPAQFGEGTASGCYGLRLLSDSSAMTSVVVPEAGAYRFSAMMRTRRGYGGGENPVTAVLRKGDRELTIFSGFVPRAHRFTPCSWYVQIDEPGTYELVLRGGIVGDRTTLVDDVSLVKADWATVTPVLGGAVFDVAEGAKLNLDFIGRARVEKVYLNGVRQRNGTVLSATTSDFVTGPGELLVDGRQRGLVLVVW